jgi:hypothetical protein
VTEAADALGAVAVAVGVGDGGGGDGDGGGGDGGGGDDVDVDVGGGDSITHVAVSTRTPLTHRVLPLAAYPALHVGVH